MAQVMRTAIFIPSSEGDSFQMLSHTFTSKVTAEDTQGQWVSMYEVTDTAGNGLLGGADAFYQDVS
jgi:hypothetical protein